MPHDDGTMDLDRIGAAALRLASSADTMNAGFQKTTAAMAAAERVAMGPSDMPRRHMWDRTAATVPMKGGDGADDETVHVPHSRRTTEAACAGGDDGNEVGARHRESIREQSDDEIPRGGDEERDGDPQVAG